MTFGNKDRDNYITDRLNTHISNCFFNTPPENLNTACVVEHFNNDSCSLIHFSFYFLFIFRYNMV
jgi:hypothetical protein